MHESDCEPWWGAGAVRTQVKGASGRRSSSAADTMCAPCITTLLFSVCACARARECFKCWYVNLAITVQSRLTSNRALCLCMCVSLCSPQPDTAGKSSLKSCQQPRGESTQHKSVMTTVLFPYQPGLFWSPQRPSWITISLCPVIARGERAKRQNMSVNNRLGVQWWYYHSRDVWLSWDPSSPRGRGKHQLPRNFISRCSARFRRPVPGRIVEQCETFTVSDRLSYSGVSHQQDIWKQKVRIFRSL